MDVGRALGAVAGPQGGPGRASGARPSGQHDIRRKKTEQAHIVVGTNGLRGPTPTVRVPDREHGARRWYVSRLFQEIREQRGLAYTAYSFPSQYTEAGMFSAYAGTPPTRAPEVLGLMRRELDDFATAGSRRRSSLVRRAT